MDSYGILITNSQKSACPLQKVRVDAKLDIDIVYVKITQEYYYSGESDAEAIYKFPLFHNVEVTDFKVKLGSEEIIKELKEKEEVFKQYEKEIFQVSLGNIKSNEKITIEMQYMEELKILGDIRRLVLPSTIAPKYLPYGFSPNIEIEYGNTKNTLDFKLRILDKYSVKEVSSPSHKLEFSYDSNDILIELSKEIEYLDRDFILNISYNALTNNSLLIGRSTIDKTKELMLEIAENQNIDGSIGEVNKGVNTSYFIIAMLLYDEENKPYRKQIKKALSYLLDEHENGLEAYLAMKLAYENDLYSEMNIEDRIERIEKVDGKGNLKYLYGVLNRNIQEFTHITIGNKLETKDFITYLFEKIHN
ncbi:VIT domain-containing protein [Tissierella sp. Yu-01]|uniref:VIT domain-containing protein n=1 Tax=Tissierella sp. Yu-01 TaxID=3035694 RepID=UPI00240DC48C|nr:VIT domain-containing protein [Tissierella sp. Yu-01]WFA08807.1 VIT domain-containing protein [Tissierella sp. Yu-01]